MKKKSKKASAKKAAKKATKKAVKKSPKKAAKKKAAKKVKKAAKKSVKKATKKTASRKKKSPAKRKAAAKKVTKAKAAKKKSAKKVSRKVVKKLVKKAAKKASPKKAAVKKARKIARPSKPKAVVNTAPAAAKPFQAHRSSLRAGEMAPYFEGTDQHGNTVRLSDFSGKKLVLYFYPKDFTEGCTAQACNLRDEHDRLIHSNYAVVGVSADDQESHAKFADTHHLPFALLADTNRSIINAYDVWGPKMMMGNQYDGIVRTTFVIDEDGRIERVIHDVNTKEHANQVMAS